MTMKTSQTNGFFGKRISDGFFGRSVRDRKSEFTVRLCRLNISVRMRFYSRINAKQNILNDLSLRRFPFDFIDFFGRISDDTSYFRIESFLDFIIEFIIAVHIDF